MKIIEPGEDTRPRHNLVGMRFRCTKCGCLFELEGLESLTETRPYEWYERNLNRDARNLSIACPNTNCRRSVRLSEWQSKRYNEIFNIKEKESEVL